MTNRHPRSEQLESFVVYGNLWLSTLLLQALHETYKEQTEPDFTWVPILLATIQNVSAAGMRVRMLPAEQQTIPRYEREITTCFLISGFGLVIPWQVTRTILWRFAGLRYRLRRTARREALYNNGNDTEGLANRSRESACSGGTAVQ